jgi:hypothetical protein
MNARYAPSCYSCRMQGHSRAHYKAQHFRYGVFARSNAYHDSESVNYYINAAVVATFMLTV